MINLIYCWGIVLTAQIEKRGSLLITIHLRHETPNAMDSASPYVLIAAFL